MAGTLQEIDLTALLTGQLDAGSAGYDHVSVFSLPGTVILVSSYPDSGDSWTVDISNFGPAPADVVVYVICSAEASGDSSTSARAVAAPARPGLT